MEEKKNILFSLIKENEKEYVELKIILILMISIIKIWF